MQSTQPNPRWCTLSTIPVGAAASSAAAVASCPHLDPVPKPKVAKPPSHPPLDHPPRHKATPVTKPVGDDAGAEAGAEVGAEGPPQTRAKAFGKQQQATQDIPMGLRWVLIDY